ncbi:hypothetical protein F8154_01655 [Alkaliphilus pronyensis]|uniref:Uncharacterized protein n=2 Tax=Alkaliphilus pronyensis TaxID=1482732 RepID=A0A6I0F6Q2_9FIRM|nr:hypothetical protein F8154_01655 [Alkaliphilus pronyensis]
MKSNAIQLIQLNAATNLLIKLGIPFDLFFLPGTRRQAAVAELVIFINPTTTIDFTISLETGGPVLGLE